MTERMMAGLTKDKPQVGLWRTQAPIPEIEPNDVLIKIKKTAICGTDLHIYRWDEWSQRNIPIPMIVGHEFFGQIVKLGSAVTGFRVGDRVSGEGHITCGHCRNCRAGKRHLCRNTKGIGVNVQGAFAEYLRLPAFNAFKIPEGIPDEIASIFDPYGNAVHTTLSFDLTGEDVLITGAGPIGLMAVAIARHVGARHVVITDVNPYRLNIATSMGASRAVDVRSMELATVMSDLGMTEGFDIGLEMSGQGDALHSMIKAMNHGGKIAVLGIFPKPITIDWNAIIFKGLHVKGIYGREMFETWYKMAAMLQSGLKLDQVITHRLPVAEYEKGFAALNAGEAVKVILDWE